MYKKRLTLAGWKHWDFMILDLVCLQVAFISAYFIRHGVHLAYENKLYRNMAFCTLLNSSLRHFLWRELQKCFEEGIL